LRAKTANFPGTTLERRVGTIRLADGLADLEGLPGLYALTAGNVEERVARDHLCGGTDGEESATWPARSESSASRSSWS
jgi:ferrous iron transport protein B